MTWPEWTKSLKEPVLLAVLAALLLEGGCNLFAGKTIWHRLSALEHSVQMLQHERELEDQRTRMRLDELQEKAEKNTEDVKEVEQKVEKKKHPQ